MIDPNCPRCNGEGWVCEAHGLTPWRDGKGCCGEPGVPCVCNPGEAMPPGFVEVLSIEPDHEA